MANHEQDAVAKSNDEQGPDARRAELELAKLEREVKELDRPWFRRPVVYVNSIVAVTALVGVAGQSLLSSIKAERTLLLSEKALQEAETATRQKEAAIADRQEARAELERITKSVELARVSLEAARSELAAAKKEARQFEQRASIARGELSQLQALVKQLSLTQTDIAVVNEFADQSLMRQIIELTAVKLGVPDERIAPESHLVRDLGADSLDLVELVMSLEEDFDLAISDEAAEKISTIQDVFDYIKANR